MKSEETYENYRTESAHEKKWAWIWTIMIASIVSPYRTPAIYIRNMFLFVATVGSVNLIGHILLVKFWMKVINPPRKENNYHKFIDPEDDY